MRGIELRERKALNTAVLGLKSFFPNTEKDIATFSETRKLSSACLFDCSSHSPQKALFPMLSLSSSINQHCEKCLRVCRKAMYESSAVFEASVDLKPFS